MSSARASTCDCHHLVSTLAGIFKTHYSSFIYIPSAVLSVAAEHKDTKLMSEAIAMSTMMMITLQYGL